MNQAQGPLVGRRRHVDKRALVKPSGQPVLCTSQIGTIDLECGYPPENVVGGADKCHFICHICKGCPRYAVELRRCGHLFCRFCIFRVLRELNIHSFTLVMASCPVCKEFFASADVLEIKTTSVCLFNLYNATDIRCTYGCQHIWSPTAMMEHETWNCRRRPVKCPNTGCKYQSTDEEMEAHLDMCPQRIIYCVKCRLPKRASEGHDCCAALTSTINLLLGDRLSKEFSVEKLFGTPGITHYAGNDDIGSHRISDEEEERANEFEEAHENQLVFEDHEENEAGAPPAHGMDELD